MFTGWKDWVCGWVQWQAQGADAEQLLSRAQQQGVLLWDVHVQDITVRARCLARQYKKLRRPARRSGMRLQAEQKHGLPFWLFRYRARKGLAVGLLAAVLLMQFLAGRVWSIEVVGADDAAAVQVLQVLEPLGLREGEPFPTAGVERMQTMALQRLPQLAFLSFRLDGSRVTVSVRPRQQQEQAPQRLPCNLTAAVDGVVQRVVASRGQAKVAVGDAVQAGQVLVSGVVEEKNATRLLHAEGEIWAQTERTFRFEVPLQQTVTDPQGECLYLPQLQIFGLKIPLYTSGGVPQGERREYTRKLSLLGTDLPVGIAGSYTYRPVTYTVRLSEQQAVQQAQQQWVQQCAQLRQAGVTVLAAEKQQSVTAAGCVLTVRCQCFENIAVSENLLRISE